MQNKNANRWLDVQVVIITLVMTISLFLWNLFAGGNRQISNVTTASQLVDPLPSSSVQTLPSGVRILLGGPAPQQLSTAQVQASSPTASTIMGTCCFQKPRRLTFSSRTSP